MTIQPITLQDARLNAKLTLQSLISQCERELRNLERFEDDRQLIATADLQYHFSVAIEAADNLEDAFQEASQSKMTEGWIETNGLIH